MVNDKINKGMADGIESIQHLAIWINFKTLSTNDIITSSKAQLDNHMNDLKSNLSTTMKDITVSTKKAELECTKLNTTTTLNSKTSLGIVEQNNKQM